MVEKNFLSLIITSQCNKNCSFCRIDKKNLFLSEKSAQKAVDFFLNLQGKEKTIKFFGGEPLLNFGLIKKIIFFAQKKASSLDKRVNFTLSTNGTLLNKRNFSFLRNNEVEIVIDSFFINHIKKEILQKLIKYDFTTLTLNILPKEKKVFEKFVKFYKLGFRRFNLLPIYYVLWHKSFLFPLRKEFKKIFDFSLDKPEIYFKNVHSSGEVPLFNSCLTCDTDGKFYVSNAILFKDFKNVKDNLLWNDEKKTDLKKIVKKVFSKKVLKSTFQADKILTNCLKDFQKKRKIKRADIKLGYTCNNRCRFCVQGRKREVLKDLTTEEIKSILRKARKTANGVVFTGGEPSIRKDFFEILSYAKKLGFERIQAQTNGRLFAYKDFAEQAVEAGMNEFGVSIHGHIPELHNWLTCSESFYQTIQGIKNVKELGIPVYTNTVITKSNYRHLPELALLLVNLGVNQFQLAFPHALGSAYENFDSIVPRMTLIMPYVKRALDIGIRNGVKVMTEAIPYCLMPGYKKFIAERIIPSTEIYELGSKIDFDKLRPNFAKSKGHNCKKCRYYNICEGTWKEYPEKFGFSEFKPVI